MQTATSPSTVHKQHSCRVGQYLHALLAGGRAVLHTWQQRHRGRRALLQLDAWLLKDLGYSRAAAAREARKPFWRP